MRTLLLASITVAAGPVVAQVPRRPTPRSVPQMTGLPAQSGAAPAVAVPAYPKGYTNKHLGGTTSTTFPNGLPERDLDQVISAADQPCAADAPKHTGSFIGK